MIDLTELDAKVREARDKLYVHLNHNGEGWHWVEGIDALISAVRTHERARCRQAVEGVRNSLEADWAEMHPVTDTHPRGLNRGEHCYTEDDMDQVLREIESGLAALRATREAP